jgi:DNA-binding FrmR family transcriptional regulator
MKPATRALSIKTINALRDRLLGVQTMVEDGRAGLEIMQQLKAARAVLLKLENAVVRDTVEEAFERSLAADTEAERDFERAILMLFLKQR